MIQSHGAWTTDKRLRINEAGKRLEASARHNELRYVAKIIDRSIGFRSGDLVHLSSDTGGLNGQYDGQMF